MLSEAILSSFWLLVVFALASNISTYLERRVPSRQWLESKNVSELRMYLEIWPTVAATINQSSQPGFRWCKTLIHRRTHTIMIVMGPRMHARYSNVLGFISGLTKFGVGQLSMTSGGA
jgi:hypothetical protein